MKSGAVQLVAVFMAILVFSASGANRPQNSYAIQVSISKQQLALEKRGKIVKVYAISTSKYGIGNQEGSQQTPLGKHRVARKFGRSALIYTIFKDRRDTGNWIKP